MENDLVEQVCVVGTGLPQPIALVVLGEKGALQPKLTQETRLQSTLTALNSTLESHQKLDRIVVMPEEWTIENGLLTPTLKVKRHILEDKFRGVIMGSYTDSVVWVK